MSTKVSPEAFIEVWQQAQNVEEVAATLGMTESGVTSRAAFYRKNGVNLKKFSANNVRLEWERLSELAESFARGENGNG